MHPLLICAIRLGFSLISFQSLGNGNFRCKLRSPNFRNEYNFDTSIEGTLKKLKEVIINYIKQLDDFDIPISKDINTQDGEV